MQTGFSDELWYLPPKNTVEIGGVFAFIRGTKEIWGREKEAGAVSLYIFDTVHIILLVISISIEIDNRTIILA